MATPDRTTRGPVPPQTTAGERGDADALTAQDKRDITAATDLINHIAERHRMDAGLPTLSALGHAVLDLALARHYLVGE